MKPMKKNTKKLNLNKSKRPINTSKMAKKKKTSVTRKINPMFIPTVNDRKLTWNQAKKKYPGLRPKGDYDMDGFLNAKDCKPFDPTKDGVFQRLAGIVTGDRVGQSKEQYQSERYSKKLDRQDRAIRKEAQPKQQPRQAVKAYIQKRAIEKYSRQLDKKDYPYRKENVPRGFGTKQGSQQLIRQVEQKKYIPYAQAVVQMLKGEQQKEYQETKMEDLNTSDAKQDRRDERQKRREERIIKKAKQGVQAERQKENRALKEKILSNPTLQKYANFSVKERLTGQKGPGIAGSITRTIGRQKGSTGVISQRTSKYGGKTYGFGGSGGYGANITFKASKVRTTAQRKTGKGRTTGKVGRPAGTLKVRINPFTGKQIKIPAKQYYKLVRQYNNRNEAVANTVDRQQVTQLARRGIPPEQAQQIVDARQLQQVYQQPLPRVQAVPEYQPQQVVQPSAYQSEYERIQRLEPWARRTAEVQLRRRMEVDQRLQRGGVTREATPVVRRQEVSLMTGRPVVTGEFQKQERWTQ